MLIVRFLEGVNIKVSCMNGNWVQMSHKNNYFNLWCTFCEKKALHIKNIRALKLWHWRGSYDWRHNVHKLFASPPPSALFTSGMTNLFSTNVEWNNAHHIFLKMSHSRPLFLYFRLFNAQLTVNKCSI